MAHKEKELINEVLLKSAKNGRMFRANSGKAWQGKIIKLPNNILNIIQKYFNKLKIKFTSIIILINTRIFHGMPEGTPDCIGWESIELCELIKKDTLEHPCKYYKNKNNDKINCVLCGYQKKIAVFKAVECKTGTQQLTPEQENFKKILEEQGGIYEIKREK